METYNATSVLMTMNLMPDLINNLKFAKGEEKIVKDGSPFKGLLSDIYIWERYVCLIFKISYKGIKSI